MYKKKLNAFTLLELIIVLVILSILIAIAIPSIGKFQESAKQKAIEMNKLALKEAATLYLIDNNWNVSSDDKISVDKLITDNYINKSGIKADDYTITVKNKIVEVKHKSDKNDQGITTK